MVFQTPAPPYLQGAISVELLDPDTGSEPLIIKETDAFEVQVKWSLDGKIANMIGGPKAFWHVYAMADPIDPTPKLSLGKATVDLTAEEAPVPDLPRDWTYKFPVAAKTLASGLYHLTVYVVYDDGNGAAYGMSGFVEIPLFEIVPA